MDLQPLFVDPILKQTYLDPGYAGHASDVWLVRTATEEAVVRASRLDEDSPHGTMRQFWQGCRHLFGIDPRRVFGLEPLNALLNIVSPIPAPRVLRKGYLGSRPAVVVERMPGRSPRGFRDQPAAMLEGLGAALAQIHSRRFPYCGNPVAEERYPVTEFPARLAATLRKLAAAEYAGDARIRTEVEEAARYTESCPPPGAGALVLLDVGSTQFLSDGERLTALVDTEAYVIGPRELDFIGLEYALDRKGASAVLAGYRSVLPPPALPPVRRVYRWLYLLLGVRGRVDPEEWFAQPRLFDDL